ncbi:MAG: hypothetical protein HZB38_10845 [Planctomycetes bacterium]|nr:hypothetical protein [Planctomycetota bacterium]
MNTLIRRARRIFADILWRAGTLLASRRRAAVVSERDIRRQLFRTQTRGMGLRFVDAWRDAFRSRWLRIRRDDASRQ